MLLLWRESQGPAETAWLLSHDEQCSSLEMEGCAPDLSYG